MQHILEAKEAKNHVAVGLPRYTISNAGKER